MYELSVVSLDGILRGKRDLWEKSVGSFLNEKESKGWDLIQMFRVEEDAVIVWKTKGK